MEILNIYGEVCNKMGFWKTKGEKEMKQPEKIRENLYILGDEKKGYRIVHPFKKDLNKPYSKDNLNWKNIILGGGWENVIKIVIIIALVLFAGWSYQNDTAECTELLENPVPFCLEIMNRVTERSIQEEVIPFEFNIPISP